MVEYDKYEAVTFKDVNGVCINIGDTLLRYFKWKQYSDEDGKRLVSGGVVDVDRFVYDNGELIAESLHWIAYKVQYSGACMILQPYKTSSQEAIRSNTKVNIKDEQVYFGSENVIMDSSFKGDLYTIYNPSLLDFDCFDV